MKEETAIPLSLFEVETLDPPPAPLKERLRSVAWSFSRRNTMEQCLQKYYLDYYGRSKRYAPNERDKALLGELKLRQNRFERTGEVVHEAIANYFRLAQKGTPQSATSLIQGAQRVLEENIVTSRAAQAGKSPGGTNTGTLLEFINDPQRAEPLYKEAGERMTEVLKNFANGEKYEKVRAAGKSPTANIERMFKLSVPCRITGIVDLAVSVAGKPAVVDWKSGKESQTEEDSLQLTAYALWGAQRFGSPPQGIAIYKAFLGAGTLTRFPLTASSVAKGERRILQDVERMTEMHPYGVEGRRRAFTPCAQAKVCVLCPYLSRCPEGKESLHD